jgi:UDP-N-acetylmuramate dehydrogenase
MNGNRVHVGAGADIQRLVLRTVRAGLAGIECLAGIPGTIGGAIKMNAGGKFGDIGAVMAGVDCLDPGGPVFERTKDDLVFEYRQSNISSTFIVGATLELEEDDPDRIMPRPRKSGCSSATASRSTPKTAAASSKTRAASAPAR